MQAETAKLQSRIEQAFRETTYPGDEYITACSCPECQDIAAYFRGKGWRGHAAKDLRQHAAALSLFTPAAYHFYLPAFILADLEDPDTADIISDSVLFDFTPRSGEALAHQVERLQTLDRAQRTAVVDYLHYISGRDGYSPAEIEQAVTFLKG